MIGPGATTASTREGRHLLEVRDLHTRFFTRDGVVNAVNGVSFTLDEGEVLGLVGESGCGKTAMALSLLRLVPEPPGRITSGQVLFQGRDLLKLNSRDIRGIRGKDVAMIFQDPLTSLNPVLTVGRQISEAIELHKGLNRADARKRSIELLEMVGIAAPGARVDDYPHQLSGGMRQRVMIAMALSCDPQVLIADEPTTALDVTVQAQILDLINRLREQVGMAIIMISHDLGVIAGIADRAAVMYAGYIVETASVDEIFHHPRHPYTVGLLRSIPRMELGRDEKLVAIEGAPPDLMDLPPGCPFRPRCPLAMERCVENPALERVSASQEVACWAAVPTGAVRPGASLGHS